MYRSRCAQGLIKLVTWISEAEARFLQKEIAPAVLHSVCSVGRYSHMRQRDPRRGAVAVQLGTLTRSPLWDANFTLAIFPTTRTSPISSSSSVSTEPSNRCR